MKRYTLTIPWALMGRVQGCNNHHNANEFLGHKPGTLVCRKLAVVRREDDRTKWDIAFSLEEAVIPDEALTPEMLDGFQDFSVFEGAKEAV